MDESGLFGQIERLFQHYGLEKPVQPPRRVTGGLMHSIYQVRTEHKLYAVKELNPSVMQRSGVIDNMINAERIAKAFCGTVPAAAALWFDNNPLLILEGRYYLLFDWLDGAPVYPPQITPDNCAQIGTLLGKMHAANLQIPRIQKEAGDAAKYEWRQYLLPGQAAGKEWVDELSRMIGDLASWNQECYAAGRLLNNNLILSHRDLDPKNVLWENNKPCIIDWEAAGYINPDQDLLERLNDWADQGNGRLDKAKFDAFCQAYTAVAGKRRIDWDTALAAGFSGMLGWLNYSFRRSLGIESASPEESELGSKQALITMKALIQYARRRTIIKKWLET